MIFYHIKNMARKSLTKNYIYNLIYQVLILVLPLVTTPYLSRVIGATGIGIYSYTYTIVSYFALFGTLGITMYGQREIAYAQEHKEKRSKIFWEIILFRIISTSIAIIVYYFWFVRGVEYQIYYKILILYLVGTALDISWFFQGMEEFKKTVTRSVLVRIISVTLIFILVKRPEDLTKYMLIYVLADLIGNLTLWAYLPKYLSGKAIKNINLKRHFGPIVLLFIPQIASQIYNMLDKTMIGKLIEDKAEVGYYEQGQKVIRVLLTIVTSLGTVMVPRMANAFSTGDKEAINDYLKKSFRFVFFLAFPVMFGISAIAQEFVPIFFGKGYDNVVGLIIVISPTILLTGIGSVIGTQYLLPTKKQKEYTISIVAGLIVNFILNYILILEYGAMGASIATVISQLVVDIIQINMIKKEVEIGSIVKSSIPYFLSGLVMFVICYFTKVIIPIKDIVIRRELIIPSGVMKMIVQILVGSVIYIGILLIRKDEYLQMFINKIKREILKREN